MGSNFSQLEYQQREDTSVCISVYKYTIEI